MGAKRERRANNEATTVPCRAVPCVGNNCNGIQIPLLQGAVWKVLQTIPATRAGQGGAFRGGAFRGGVGRGVYGQLVAAALPPRTGPSPHRITLRLLLLPASACRQS